MIWFTFFLGRRSARRNAEVKGQSIQIGPDKDAQEGHFQALFGKGELPADSIQIQQVWEPASASIPEVPPSELAAPTKWSYERDRP